MQASEEVKTAPYPGYRTLWIWLALGWVASGVDRTITGPVMTYMIDIKVPLLQGVENPFAVGGLVGSLLPCRDTPGARLDGSREESEGRCAHE